MIYSYVIAAVLFLIFGFNAYLHVNAARFQKEFEARNPDLYYRIIDNQK